ncbi:hypothetical protein V8C86DRAFT_2824458 [Haematococcus lacustris]
MIPLGRALGRSGHPAAPLACGAIFLPRSPTLRRKRPCHCSVHDGDEVDAAGDDSEGWAAALSREAARMRQSMDDDEFTDLSEFAEVAQNAGLLLPQQMAVELQAQVWSELGPDGGFESEDFELVQRIGRISVQAAATTSDAQSSTAVVAYIARYVACGLYARPPAALVKEYLPVAKSIALNELLLLHHLCGVPEDKHQAIMAAPSSEVPVVPLLGYFTSSPSEEAQLVGKQDRSMATVAEEPESLWLVYSWEGLRPLALYNQAGPPVVKPRLFQSRQAAEEEAWQARVRMLRRIAVLLLQAVDYCHSADVVHGSISSGSVLMNTAEDIPRLDLVALKLDGFGFGKFAPAPGNLESFEAAKRADIVACGLLLAETFACGLADGPSGVMTPPTLRRLLFTVFPADVEGFRAYLHEDGHHERFAALLENAEARDFLHAMLYNTAQQQATALQLLQHDFLTSP